MSKIEYDHQGYPRKPQTPRPVMTWDADGKAFIAHFDRDAGKLVIDRPATEQDRADLTNGLISYDPTTNPSSIAWAKHVAAGGD